MVQISQFWTNINSETMSKVNTELIVRLVLEVDLYKRPTSIPIITVSKSNPKVNFLLKLDDLTLKKGTISRNLSISVPSI